MRKAKTSHAPEQADTPTQPDVTLLLEMVALDQLKPHPRNYKVHPDDEVAHVRQSLREHGYYRNIVIANENTILAGHCVVQGAIEEGILSLPVHRKDYGPFDPRALKLLAGDNEISHLGIVDDRALTELLREVKESDIGLLGTGYDEAMLANLLFVTRPTSEIADLGAAAQWVGMPEYDMEGGEVTNIQILVNFKDEEDRKKFCHLLDINVAASMKRATIWWPRPAPDDVRSVRFTDRDIKGGEAEDG